MTDIDEIKEKIKRLELKRTPWNVSKESINFILDYIEKNNYKTVLEIGGYNGYSALHFSLIANEVVSLEKDKHFANEFKKNTENVNNIKLIEDDALNSLQKLNKQNKKYDFIFIDARKDEYKQYLELSLPLINKKGTIFADNTISHKKKLKEFFDFIKNKKLYSEELNLGDGLMVVKKND